MEQEEDEWATPLQILQGCYNINVDEDDDPRNVNIAEWVHCRTLMTMRFLDKVEGCEVRYIG